MTLFKIIWEDLKEVIKNCHKRIMDRFKTEWEFNELSRAQLDSLKRRYNWEVIYNPVSCPEKSVSDETIFYHYGNHYIKNDFWY